MRVRPLLCSAMAFLWIPVSAQSVEQEVAILLDPWSSLEDCKAAREKVRASSLEQQQAAMSALIKGMLHEDDGVRGQAMDTLGHLGRPGPECVPHLVRVLEEITGQGVFEVHLCRLALQMLIKLGPDAADAVPVLADHACRDGNQLKRHALIALSRIGAPAEPALPRLEKLLQAQKPKTRDSLRPFVLRIELNARLALANQKTLNAETARELLRSIDDNDDDLARQLVAIETAGAWINRMPERVRADLIKRLMALISEENKEPLAYRRKGAAAMALAALDTLPPVLIKTLKAESDAFRYSIIDAFEKDGTVPGNGIEVLTELIRMDFGPNSQTARRCMKSLRWIAPKHPDVVRVLTEQADKNPKLRQVALEALLRSGPAAVSVQARHLKDSRLGRFESGSGSTIRAMVASGPASVPPLIGALQDDDAYARSLAAFILGELGEASAAAAPKLGQLLAEDQSEEVRFHSAVAIARIAPRHARKAVPLLTKVLNDPELVPERSRHQPVARLCLEALGNMGSVAGEALPAIATFLREDHNGRSHSNAVLARWRIDGDARAAVASLRRYYDRQQPKTDSEAYGRLHTFCKACTEMAEAARPATPFLCEFLESAGGCVPLVIETLLAIKPWAHPALQRVIKTVPTEGTLDLLAVMDVDGIRVFRPELEKLLKHHDTRIRRKAFAVLQRIKDEP